MKKAICIITAFLLSIAVAQAAFAYTVPQDDSRIKYFYVFGPQGDPLLGAEADHKLTFYIDVPEDAADNLSIGIYDPDTGGRLDYRAKYEEPWDTVTEFAVYGSDDVLLDKRRFGQGSYDRRYFEFGPYAKTQGQKMDKAYRFRLDVTATEGNDGNLFNIKISPENVEVFSYKFTFRLLEPEGEKMYLYPEVPAGATEIIVDNYDMDPDGGTSELFDPETGRQYTVNDSESAMWAKTAIPITANQIKRMRYVITKKTQNRAHAGVVFRDDKGEALPIYFKPGKPLPGAAPIEIITPDCRDFTFDATESYDPDNQQLSYHWDFGDGATSTEPVVTHRFEKGGQYTVTLKVTDNSGLKCDTATTTETVIVNSPPQAAFTCQEKVCSNQEVNFDAGLSEDNTPDSLTYKWDFGDGTSGEGKQVTKVYAKGGIYRAVLIVNDNAGTTCSIGRAIKNIIVNAPPVVGTYEDIDMCIPLGEEYKVNFNFAENVSIFRGNLKYHWDFGDGTTAEGKSVTHIYSKSGEYAATLSVDDGLGLPCSTGSATVNVRLSKQPVAEAGDDITSCLGTDIIFDGSRSRAEDKEALIYTWDFGDGTANVQGSRASHTYKKPGTYKATLSVNDARSRKCAVSKDTLSVLINTRPSITLKEVKSVCVGSSIDFEATLKDSGDMNKNLKYRWDFGDGTVTEAGPRISHTYQKGGEYVVGVSVDDQLGTSCSTDTQSVKVKVNTAPVANAGPNLVCCADTESVFDGSGSYDPDGDTLTYIWDFGDGNTARGAKVTHVYKKIGIYKVTLTVDDNSGTPCSSSTSSFEATVNERPVSIIKVREGKTEKKSEKKKR